MALFKFSDKKEEKSRSGKPESEKVDSQKATDSDKGKKKESLKTQNSFLKKVAGDVIVQPRITEKATSVQEGDVYVFEIFPEAGKKDVFKAIKEIYKVDPRKINIVKNPPKSVFVRGKKGVKPGVKKAYVYLKKGERIEIV